MADAACKTSERIRFTAEHCHLLDEPEHQQLLIARDPIPGDARSQEPREPTLAMLARASEAPPPSGTSASTSR